jgi:Ala-tRNA(Pro) deacylase
MDPLQLRCPPGDGFSSSRIRSVFAHYDSGGCWYAGCGRPDRAAGVPSRQEAIMSVVPTVQEFLRRANVPYTVFPHARAYTAQEEAAVTHVPGRAWAKAVICFVDGEPIQAVVPADLVVDLDRLAIVAGATSIRLAEEDELRWLYPDCERGAMPPLGPLYRQTVYADEALADDDEIVFNAGTHGDAIRMRYDDFAAIAHPIVGRFARRPAFL